MKAFQYHPEIIERFPGVNGGVLVAEGLRNQPSSTEFRAQYLSEQEKVLARIGSTPLSEIETLAAWRAAFRSFGVDPTGYRSAAEALLRRLTKKGDIPSINTLVDICNLVSIRYGLPVAAFDTRHIEGGITVRFARGDETFYNLGGTEGEHPNTGEVIFTDKADVVLARRWCWRQSEESAAREETTGVIITVESQNPGGRELIKRALEDLRTILQPNVGGEFSEFILP